MQLLEAESRAQCSKTQGLVHKQCHAQACRQHAWVVGTGFWIEHEDD